MIDSLPPAAPIPPPTLLLSDDVVIEFHEGARPAVWWAPMHIGPQAIEVGSVRDDDDLDNVLTMAAGVLLERTRYADLVSISPGGARWVLIGRWVLNAHMSRKPGHEQYPSRSAARAAFYEITRAER